MYFLSRPDDAFEIMRKQGIGIKNTDLEKIPEASSFCSSNSTNCEVSNNSFANQHKGKIFQQIENNGEAWYISPLDLKRYYMGRPNDAFGLMKNLGLGISNHDFENLLSNKEGIENWNTYKNETIGFQVDYPKGWIHANQNDSGVQFGTPESRQGGYIWGLSIHQPNEMEKIIFQAGIQFDDRKEARNEILIGNNINATLVTITTDKYPDWVSKKVFFEFSNQLFVLGNGAIIDSRFEDFYQSFKSID